MDLPGQDGLPLDFRDFAVKHHHRTDPMEEEAAQAVEGAQEVSVRRDFACHI